jgi:hypothetical protein
LKQVSDTGYLAIAIFSLVVNLLFFGISSIADAITRNHIFSYYRVISIISPMVMFTILFSFSQRKNYRTIIAIIGVITILSNIYTMLKLILHY